MATIQVIPSKKTIVDDRNGNTFIIYEVYHTTGKDSEFDVPDSAISVAELPAANGDNITATQGTTGSNTDTVTVASGAVIVHNTTTGTSPAGFSYAANDGIKQVIIDADAASGTLQIVVRCIGGGAGTGSTNALNL